MITLAYEWDGSFSPSDFGLALNWIRNISRSFWQSTTSDFFIYFIIVLFVLPPVIYIIGCLIIDMVNYRVPYPSHNSPYKGVYDNGQGVWNKNNTVWGAALRRSKWQKKNKKQDPEPSYDIVKEKVVDEYGNETEYKYVNDEYKGKTTWVNNKPPKSPDETVYETTTDEKGNRRRERYVNGEYMGSNTYVDNEKPYKKYTESWYDNHGNRGSKDYVNGKYKGQRRYKTHFVPDNDGSNSGNNSDLDIEFND